jgi:Nif-specific regulatory protein
MPTFLDSTARRTSGVAEPPVEPEPALIRVPIKIGDNVVGMLSAACHNRQVGVSAESERLLDQLAAMVAEGVRVRMGARRESRRLQQENRELRARLRPIRLVGDTASTRAVHEMIARVAQSDAPVMIRGESGVGKELVAHAVHEHSRRASRPFVKVNCAALPSGALESELLVHEAGGAFAGAALHLRRCFERAHSGTIFLEEIGDLPAEAQLMLLRVLQDREIERVRRSSTIKVDVRVIAASSRDLAQLVAEGRFREDLYFRLRVFPIRVPPLRERIDDIALLADLCAQRHAKACHRAYRSISPAAIDLLRSYPWPGNVRELENCIERAVLLSDDGEIDARHLPLTVQTPRRYRAVARDTLQVALEAFERELVEEALGRHWGNMAAAARELGLTERVMGLRVRKYGLDWRHFRPAAEVTSCASAAAQVKVA